MSPSAPSVSITAAGPRLRVWQSLQFKLGVLLLAIGIALGLLGWIAGHALVQSPLLQDTGRYQRESGRRLVVGIESDLERVQALANVLAELANNQSVEQWAPRVPALVAGSGLAESVAGVGWWPEPVSKSAARTSRFWLADASSGLQAREDYNDSRTIAYWEEPWYTPARYATAGDCYWTLAFQERLSRRRVVACTLPLRKSQLFLGAVTVLLDIGTIARELKDAARAQSGYALLVDRDNHLLAASGLAADRLAGQLPRNLAQLAQQHPSFNTLALELHRRDEAFLARAAESPLYDAARVTELQAATREGSQQESESALALIWNDASPAARQDRSLDELAIRGDAFIGDDAVATLFEMSGPYWKLVRVTPALQGLAGARHYFDQTLAIVFGALGLSLLLIFIGLRRLVLQPLARMATRLSDTRSLEECLHLQLDAGAPNELGVIGHWYNERIHQLRESMDRVMSQQSQLVVESSERARADEQAIRLRERAAAIISSVSDATLVVDARGLVEDMNGHAEKLTGVSARAARGRPCADILHLRLANRGGTAPDFAGSVIASSTRIEHSDGLFLHVEGRSEREIHLIGSPLRGPGGRNLGAVLVFRTREAPSSAPKLVIDRRSVDTVTGLPTRAACDRRLRALLDAARLQPRTHGLIVADVDRLRQVNENLGLQAGDEVLVRVAEALVAAASGAEVFRLGGDAFAVILEGTTDEDARRIARELCDALATLQFSWAERSLSVTASFGLATFDGGVEHPLELVRRAEDACDAAKRAGRNTLRVYDASMNRRESALAEAVWVRRIRAGLDEGLLHLTTQWVQPGDPHAHEGGVFEVSLALEDEEGFWAEPESFLPIAERTGLIADVERWALRQTIEQIGRNPALVERLAFVTVPLSAQTVSEGATLELLAHLFQAQPGLATSKLCFALRETVLSESPGPAQTFCDAMRSLGCRVMLEQFSTRGAAAVELLRRLPADFLRIDARHFVDIRGDAVDQAIADSTIRLARTLQRRVIVSEIVDTPSRDTWKRMGADYFQGLVIARPSPVVFSGNS